jgi:hypothetical protein
MSLLEKIWIGMFLLTLWIGLGMIIPIIIFSMAETWYQYTAGVILMLFGHFLTHLYFKEGVPIV